MNNMSNNVYFADFFSPAREFIGIVSYLHSFDNKDIEHSRFYTVKNKQWGHQEIDHEIKSVTYTNDPAWWLLSKRGVIVCIRPSGISEEVIPLSGTGHGRYGYLNKIVTINEDLYVCGYRRQVYRRANNIWKPIDNDIRASLSIRGVGFFSMDGTGANNIYAVGRKGEVFHFDGKRWTNCDVPTNVALESVKCDSSEMTYICGGKGTILYGNRNSWNVVQYPDFDDTFWSVTVFKGIPYFAHMGGIVRLINGDLEEVDMNSINDSYHIQAIDDKLWSIGQHRIASFDGNQWEEIICPDNM